MRSTHTYVILEINSAAHAEIKAKLLAAGYQHAIDGDMIDMHGIALEPDAPAIQEATILKHDPDDAVTINAKGNLSGTEESMVAFRKFAAKRDKLLNRPFDINEQVFARF